MRAYVWLTLLFIAPATFAQKAAKPSESTPSTAAEAQAVEPEKPAEPEVPGENLLVKEFLSGLTGRYVDASEPVHYLNVAADPTKFSLRVSTSMAPDRPYTIQPLFGLAGQIRGFEFRPDVRIANKQAPVLLVDDVEALVAATKGSKDMSPEAIKKTLSKFEVKLGTFIGQCLNYDVAAQVRERARANRFITRTMQTVVSLMAGTLIAAHLGPDMQLDVVKEFVWSYVGGTVEPAFVAQFAIGLAVSLLSYATVTQYFEAQVRSVIARDLRLGQKLGSWLRKVKMLNLESIDMKKGACLNAHNESLIPTPADDSRNSSEL